MPLEPGQTYPEVCSTSPLGGGGSQVTQVGNKFNQHRGGQSLDIKPDQKNMLNPCQMIASLALLLQ